MNEKLPFEDAFERRMNDMQIPSADEAWQKMNVLLEKKKKRRPFMLFRFYRLAGFVVLMILVSAGAFIFFKSASEKALTNSGNKSTALAAKKYEAQRNTQTSNLETTPDNGDSSSVRDNNHAVVNTNKNKKITAVDELKKGAAAVTVILEKKGTATNANKKHETLPGSAIAAKSITVNDHFNNKRVNEKVLQTSPPFDFAGNKVKRKNKLLNGEKTLALPKVAEREPNKYIVRTDPERKDTSHGIDVIQLNAQSSISISGDPELVSITNITKDLKPLTAATFHPTPLQHPIKLNDSLANNMKAAGFKKAPSRHGKYFIAAGVGLQQQVPVGGQKFVGYNSGGNKNIIADYIPSVYVRLEKDRQWFLQGEFSYAAPQLVKPFSYQQQTDQNFAAGAYTIHSADLRKTFYNKLPVSFNYYILPRFSIGAGAEYSWLHSAVSESKTITKNVTTRQQTVTNQLVTMKGYTDSFLYRSHTYLLLKANYSVKRFSFGVGFATDLQPYIKFTLPDGTVSQLKNWSLNFSLLFRLYQSRNFSLSNKKKVKK